MKEEQKKKLKVGGVIATVIGVLMMFGDSGATGFIISFLGVILIFAGYSKTKEPVKVVEKTPEQKAALVERDKKVKNALAIVFAVGAMFVSYAITSDSPTSVSTPQPEQQHYSQVCAQAEVYVKQLLKSPSTADFPTCNESRLIREPDNRFIVTSYVDSQNSFGAMIRTPWQVYLKYTPDDKVIFEDVRFDGKSIYDAGTTE